ncbi:MAG: hypothetical protein AAB638_00605 [Patescibacteria group bacterium]
MATLFEHLKLQGRITEVVATIGIDKVMPAETWERTKPAIAKKVRPVLAKTNLKAETRQRWNRVAIMVGVAIRGNQN